MDKMVQDGVLDALAEAIKANPNDVSSNICTNNSHQL